MFKRIVKGIFEVSSILSFLSGVFVGFHLMFYPNVGFSNLEGWRAMIFCFGNGLLLQSVALHFFNEQSDQEESN